MRRSLVAVLAACALLTGPAAAAVHADQPVSAPTAVYVSGPGFATIGETIEFQAWAFMPDGARVDVTGTAEWSTAHTPLSPAAAREGDPLETVGGGQFQAVGGGSTEVIASYMGVDGSYSVHVWPPVSVLKPTAKRVTVGLDTVIQYSVSVTTSNGAGDSLGPVAGARIEFVAPAGNVACAAITNSAGTAMCSVKYDPVKAILGLVFTNDGRFPPAKGQTFRAVSAGDQNHLGGSGSGTIG